MDILTTAALLRRQRRRVDDLRGLLARRPDGVVADVELAHGLEVRVLGPVVDGVAHELLPAGVARLLLEVDDERAVVAVAVERPRARGDLDVAAEAAEDDVGLLRVALDGAAQEVALDDDRDVGGGRRGRHGDRHGALRRIRHLVELGDLVRVAGVGLLDLERRVLDGQLARRLLDGRDGLGKPVPQLGLAERFQRLVERRPGFDVGAHLDEGHGAVHGERVLPALLVDEQGVARRRQRGL
mmetsp:Transcript_15569/g.53963  ORF Transcript_15569/g.53963 Transcript_15569/m.53963 type:complete len:241 (+) Transcript_15569:362-1084(+)